MNIDELKLYIERTKRISELSSPQVDRIASAENYQMFLLSSFTEIGKLSQQNDELLCKNLRALFYDDEVSKEDIEDALQFSQLLVDATNVETIDTPMIWKIANRVLSLAEKTGDTRLIIKALDNIVISSYMMLNTTKRLYPDYDNYLEYVDIGLETSKRIISYLDKEKFSKLPDEECKEIVLINVRYIRCFFEWDDQPERLKVKDECLQLLQRALDIANDSFYREQAPNYNWDYHIFRTLQYASDLAENQNARGFDESTLKQILEYTYQLNEYLQQHPEFIDQCPKIEQDYLLVHNEYLCGLLTKAEYKDKMIDLIDITKISDFSPRSMFVNFTIPLEYILSLDKENLSEREKRNVNKYYREIVSYVYHMPRTGAISFMLTFLADVLHNYIDIPGGMSFEEFCLKLIAAVHPPTFVHTHTVAKLANFLTTYLLNKKPELFVGTLQCKSIEDVKNNQQVILDFMQHSALLHDVGKLFILETIITYGRTLTDFERKLLETHTRIGGNIISSYSKTKPYAYAALGHHKWYDNNGGYPKSFDLNNVENPVLLEILAAVDCLDAATDFVGRSYKPGKTLEEYIYEIQELSGVRYAPEIVKEFSEPEVYEGFQRIITEERNENYRQAYRILKEL